MFLFINSQDQEKITIALIKSDGILLFKKTLKAKFKHSEKLLPAIDKILKKCKIKIESLKGIVVVRGLGSFTSLRIGVVTANTLAWALKIPVLGIKLSQSRNLRQLIDQSIKKIKEVKSGKFVLPFYGKKLNITWPKTKVLKNR